MFEKMKRDADEIRRVEKAILEDYENGMDIEEIRIKHKKTTQFVRLTIQYYYKK